MKDIVIGDTLKDEVDVIATLKIKGGTEHCFYKIWSEKLQSDILVTGSHKIIDPITNKLISVENYDLAELVKEAPEHDVCIIKKSNMSEFALNMNAVKKFVKFIYMHCSRMTINMFKSKSFDKNEALTLVMN